MNAPPIVAPQEWEAARQELLVKEKQLTRARDALAADRRRMPRLVPTTACTGTACSPQVTWPWLRRDGEKPAA